jgi:curli biogenesis system outer membrane secretion channel CsgG
MKTHTILAISLALAVCAPAFAQDNSQAQAGDQAAPADSQSMHSDARQPAPNTTHRRVLQHRATRHNNANMALTGDEPRIVAYQGSPQFKTYPSVDTGHVPGDPPVIDHSADRAGSPTPTTTTITIPPGH